MGFMPVTTLDKLVPGESGRIIKINGKGAIRRRLVDMGLTTGAVIDMVKQSPLGDPVEYRLRGYHLSLRKSEAKTIEVELLSDSFPMRGRGHISGSGLTLRACRVGQKVIITRTRGGKRFQRKLEELELIPGSEVSIIQNEFPGPLIISINDGKRLVIGKGMAMHIMVKPS
jgi:ferrous iron transport protein A